jgi:Transposase, Mutator family
MLSVVTDAQAQDELRLDLDQLVREGARRMLAVALEAEVDAYLAAYAVERDEGGPAAGGAQRPRPPAGGHHRGGSGHGACAAGGRPPDRPGERWRMRFRSVILPPWCRKSPKVAEVLPLLYLHGLSTGDFVPALAAFFGSAAGLSAAVITRLVAAWQADHEAFGRRDLTDRDDVYVWADGVHFRVRLEQARLCCLVLVGCAPTAPKSWSRWPMASGSRPTAGLRCCVTCGGVGCRRRSWRSVTARWAVGGAARRLPPRLATSAIGSTSSPTCSAACPPPARPAPARPWLRSATPRP